MQKLALTFSVVLICGAVAYAGPEAIQSSGKEMKQIVEPAPTCDFSWTGFYVGGHVGYGWSSDDDADIRLVRSTFPDFTVDPDHQDLDSSGFVGGGQLGFNWQIGKWFVLGAEADFSGSDISGDSTRSSHVAPVTTSTAEFRVSQDIDWYGTLRGRVGFVPWCRLLVYGTGGFAYADVNNSGELDFRPFGGLSHFPASNNDTEIGWTAGGGLEFGINRHWTVKVEYLYIDVGDNSATVVQVPNANTPPLVSTYNWENKFQTVTAGLNFKF